MTDPGRPWSAPRSGIQIRLTTDRPAYRRGDAIALQLSFRNVDVTPWVLSMSPWTSPPAGQFADSPMYGLRTPRDPPRRHASVEAFWAARFIGLSYRGAELVRDAGFRLGSGALDTPPCELVLGP
jgi:hypothetical protein